MAHRFADIAFTPAVQALQEHHGSRMQYARMQARGRTNESLGPREKAFLGEADSFHMATVSETGWPYAQHRGGPKGFVRVLSTTRLAFPDFRGNLQFVSAGNATLNDRVSLIFIDYANPQRLKLFGHLRFIDVAAADPELLRAVELPHYPARVERVALIDVVALDWNCPQHITPRFTKNQLTVTTDATVVTDQARTQPGDSTALNAPPQDTPARLPIAN